MKNGTQNYLPGELQKMQENPGKYAMETGRRLPYHLQYIRDGKVNVKPEGENERVLRDE